MFQQLNHAISGQKRLRTWAALVLMMLFFGAVATLPNRSAYSSYLESTPTPTPITLNQLRQMAASRGILIGTTDGGFNTPLYANTIPFEFDSITTESVTKFENIHPCPPPDLINSNPAVRGWVQLHGLDRDGSQYDCTLVDPDADEWEWADVDNLIAWADAHDLTIFGPTLIWRLQNPAWISPTLLSTQELQQVMVGHINDVIEHYCTYNDIHSYIVVNEAIMPDGNLWIKNPWSSIPNHIDIAYRVARNTLDQCGRPDVKLFYNDFDFEYGRTLYFDEHQTDGHQFPPGYYDKTEAIYNYLSNLLSGANPTPIDGIGFQTHVGITPTDLSPHSTSEMVETMNRFTDGLGLEVAVTERDVPIGNTWTPQNYYDEQAVQFRGTLDACLLARHCIAFITWGTHDGSSWLTHEWGDTVDPLLFWDARERVYDPDIRQCIILPSPTPTGQAAPEGGTDTPTLQKSPEGATSTPTPGFKSAPTNTPTPTGNTPTRTRTATIGNTPTKTGTSTKTPTPTRTPTSTSTPNEMYCPKPAYGSVYDGLVRGVIRIFLPFVARSGGAGESNPEPNNPYPPPSTPGTPYP